MKGAGTMTYGGESKGNCGKSNKQATLDFTSLKIVRA